MERKVSAKTLKLVQLALLGALIFVLAFTPFIGYIPLGVTRATIVHIPVIIGSILLGPKMGAVLGGLFGLTSFINNSFISPSITSFTFTPLYSVGEFHGNVWSLVICFVPRILVGVVPYSVYKFVMWLFKGRKGGETVSLALAGLSGALTNTLLVLLGILVFFAAPYAQANNQAIWYLLGTSILFNGIPEAIVTPLVTVAVVKPLSKLKSK